MIEISFNTLFKEFKYYFIQLPNAYSTLAVLSISLISTFFLYLIFLRTVQKNETPILRSTLSIIYSMISIGVILVGFSVYHTKFTSLIFSKHLQSVLIIEIILILVVLGFLFNRFFRLLKKRDIRVQKLIEGPMAMNEAITRQTLTIKKSRRLIWVLVLPFILLLITPSTKYLYSIIFDNSTSMEAEIEFAKTSMEDVLEKIKPNSFFVLTSFPRCNDENTCKNLVQKLITDIDSVNTVPYNDLVAETVITTNSTELQGYFKSDALELTGCGSPVIEAIWQNFMNAITASEEVAFTKKRMIILSDGEDHMYRRDLAFKRPNKCIFDMGNGERSMSDFYDEITVIKYKGYGSDNITNSCAGINVYDGDEASSFDKSFIDQMEDIYFDKYFLIIVAMVLLIGLLFITNIR